MFGKQKTSRATAWRRLAAIAVTCGMLALQTGCRAEEPWPLWQQYHAKFIDGSGRVIDHSAAAQDHTTSEGMAYGMFFALVANDRPTFDKLLKWTEDNLAGGDLTARLPSWRWGKAADGQWKTIDTNSASDADLWMAYDLLEAGRLWKDVRLGKLGEVMIDRIAHAEVAQVPGLGPMLLPGPQGFHPQPNVYILNPSYLPPEVLARLKQQAPQGPWAAILDELPSLLKSTSPNGYAMDWVAAGSGLAPSISPSDLAAGKQGIAPVGAYEAIRVYLWLGMADRGTMGVSDQLQAISGMDRYMQANVIPPLQVDSAGKVINPEGTVGFSAAVIPYLTAMGNKSAAGSQLTRLQASADPSTGLYGRSAEYYDQNLALFATGWQEGRFRFDRDGRLKLKWK